MKETIQTIVFDIGGVLLDWSPRYLYENVFKNADDLEWFLKNVCPIEWNAQMDAGRSFKEVVKETQEKFPKFKKEIAMYDTGWSKMIRGSFEGTVKILRHLKEEKWPLYAITNFSAEKFKEAKKEFDYLSLFDGIVVSGEEKMIKPDPRIFTLFCERFRQNPKNCLFIDDNKANIDSAKTLGFSTIQFRSEDQFAADLKALNIL